VGRPGWQFEFQPPGPVLFGIRLLFWLGLDHSLWAGSSWGGGLGRSSGAPWLCSTRALALYSASWGLSHGGAEKEGQDWTEVYKASGDPALELVHHCYCILPAKASHKASPHTQVGKQTSLLMGGAANDVRAWQKDLVIFAHPPS
jgi:hypothetical protein